MTSDANLCSVCGKSKVANEAAPDAHCKGHAAPAEGMKAQLDAIKAPGAAPAPTAAPSQPVKVVPPPVPAPKPASSQQNLKAQLDAIPGPGGAKSAPAPAASAAAPAPAPVAAPAPTAAKANEPSIADQLAAIPTPGAKTPPPASITKNQLDAIPAPGAAPAKPAAAPVAPSAPAASLSFQDQLNAIPTPGMSRPAGSSGEQGSLDDLDSIPTPRPGAAPPPPATPPGEQPQWMKNYNTYKSDITASSASGFPVQDPYANYKPQNRDAPSSGTGGYMLVAIFVGVLIIGYFCVITMQKPPPLDTNQLGAGTSTSTSAPSSTLPGHRSVHQLVRQLVHQLVRLSVSLWARSNRQMVSRSVID